MKMKDNQTLLGRTALSAAVALGVFCGPAFAEGDLVFMHNASPYFIWTERDACVNDMRFNSNKCVTFRVCGNHYASTEATLNVGADKFNRYEPIVVRRRDTNSVVCTMQKE